MGYVVTKVMQHFTIVHTMTCGVKVVMLTPHLNKVGKRVERKMGILISVNHIAIKLVILKIKVEMMDKSIFSEKVTTSVIQTLFLIWLF